MKKVSALIAALSVACLALAGCGGTQSQSSGTSAVAQNTSGMKTLKVGATSVPHAEILEAAKPLLEKEGIKLDIVEFNDYVQPNLALNDKELDANYFQHEPYLKNFIDEHKEVKLINAAGIHIEPMGIYSRKVKDLKELKDGASIAIPNDPTNGGRALLLLQKAGLLTLKDGVAEKATIQDITENPHNFKFQEVEAAQVPRTLDDVDAAIINSNFAMQVNLDPTRTRCSSKTAPARTSTSSPYAPAMKTVRKFRRSSKRSKVRKSKISLRKNIKAPSFRHSDPEATPQKNSQIKEL